MAPYDPSPKRRPRSPSRGWEVEHIAADSAIVSDIHIHTHIIHGIIIHGEGLTGPRHMNIDAHTISSSEWNSDQVR